MLNVKIGDIVRPQGLGALFTPTNSGVVVHVENEEAKATHPAVIAEVEQGLWEDEYLNDGIIIQAEDGELYWLASNDFSIVTA